MRSPTTWSHPDHHLLDLLRQRDRLCIDFDETRHPLPAWAMAPLLVAGLSRAELERQAVSDDGAIDRERLQRIEERIAAIDAELLELVIQARSGQAGERASLAVVVRVAADQLRSGRSEASKGRHELVARLLDLAARSFGRSPATGVAGPAAEIASPPALSYP